MHEEGSNRLIYSVQHVLQFVKDYIMAFKTKRAVEGVHRQTILVGWNPHASGWIRLNSCKECGVMQVVGWIYSKCVGICRAYVGEFVCVSARVCVCVRAIC